MLGSDLHVREQERRDPVQGEVGVTHMLRCLPATVDLPRRSLSIRP
jgi:hypothetical protein